MALTSPAPKISYDAKGMLCPLPVLKARKLLETLAPGEQLEIFTTDEMARLDLPHFCKTQGHVLLVQEAEGAAMRFVIAKGDAAL